MKGSTSINLSAENVRDALKLWFDTVVLREPVNVINVIINGRDYGGGCSDFSPELFTVCVESLPPVKKEQ